jgi:hypothetical protein
MRKIKKERVLSSERKNRNHSGGIRRRKKVCKNYLYVLCRCHRTEKKCNVYWRTVNT